MEGLERLRSSWHWTPFFEGESYAHALGQELTIINSYTSGVPPNLAPHLIPQVKGYLSTADFTLLSLSLGIVALLLELSPASTFPEVERDLLPDLYAIAYSPLISGAALESLFKFFAALVQADDQITTHVIPNLVNAVEKAPRAETSPTNVAKCIAAVVKSQQGVAAGVIAEYSKNFKVGALPFTGLLLQFICVLECIEGQAFSTDLEFVDHRRARSLYVRLPIMLVLSMSVDRVDLAICHLRVTSSRT